VNNYKAHKMADNAAAVPILKQATILQMSMPTTLETFLPTI
jgi:hypothetical protein